MMRETISLQATSEKESKIKILDYKHAEGTANNSQDNKVLRLDVKIKANIDTYYGPSRKRSRSSATSIPSTVHTAGALSPTRADLLPPRKMHLDESGNESSPETHTNSDMDSYIQADIEAETPAAATTASTTLDGSDIQPIMAGVKTGFEPGLAVVEFERIDIPHDLPTPDTMERLGQVEEGM
nr:hypothetical protein [Tanacetum cinerariifolium]